MDDAVDDAVATLRRARNVLADATSGVEQSDTMTLSTAQYTELVRLTRHAHRLVRRQRRWVAQERIGVSIRESVLREALSDDLLQHQAQTARWFQQCNDATHSTDGANMDAFSRAVDASESIAAALRTMAVRPPLPPDALDNLHS